MKEIKEITKKGNFKRHFIKLLFSSLERENKKKEELYSIFDSLLRKREEEPSLIMEFVGLKLKVLNSSSTFKGKEGIIIWETRNTFKILTLHKKKSYDILDIPKKGNVFELSLKGERFKLVGDEIAYSPIERAKRLRSWRIRKKQTTK